jgi:hypothetical protein
VTTLARLVATFWLVVSAAVGTLVLAAGPATAGCVVPSADFLDDNDVAFSGVVKDRREAGDDIITTVRVDRVFKGDITRRVDVVSPAADGADDVAMEDEPGALLIVFGDLESGEVTSSLCSSVSGPDEEYYDPILAELGEGTEPAPGYMKAERRGLGLSYEQFSGGRAILGVLGLSSLGYFAFRAWRSRRRTPGNG